MNTKRSFPTQRLPNEDVLAYDNPDVIHRIAKDNNLSVDEATGVFRDTIRFLYLAGTTMEKNIVPTKRIDQGWHAFLLYSRDYTQFCENHFGHFIHHEPSRLNAPKKAVDGAALTFDLARKVFGPDLSANWNYEIRGADCDSNKCNSSCSPETGGSGSECTPDYDSLLDRRTQILDAVGEVKGRSTSNQMDFEHLDLDPIKVKLTDPVHGEGWTHAKVEKVASQYRRFLTLVRENPETAIVPTEAVDEFWHCHILDTMKYAEDCNDFFGYFVHHFPYIGLRGEDDVKLLEASFKKTTNLYEARFGESMTPTNAHLTAADCKAGCGSVVCKAGTCNSHRPDYKPQLALDESLTPTNGAGCGSVVCAAGTCNSHRPEYKPQLALDESLTPTNGAGCGSVVCAAGTCNSHRPDYKPQLAAA